MRVIKENDGERVPKTNVRGCSRRLGIGAMSGRLGPVRRSV